MFLRKLPAFILIISLAFSVSCISSRIYPGGMEPALSLNPDADYEVLGTGEGMASSFRLFWIFPVTPDADINRAVTEAASVLGGDDIIEVRWWKERKVYILGTVDIIHVRGKVIKYNR